MLEYPKVKTLFKRGDDFKVTSELTMREFDLVDQWVVSEKIHGQNIRIHWDGETVTYGTRTTIGAEFLPGDLVDYLDSIFTVEKLTATYGATEVTLFGEGYGAGINKGGDLSATKRFALFDVFINNYWLETPDMEQHGAQLGCEMAPVFRGMLTLAEIIPMVRNGMNSLVAANNTGKEVIAEGIVARTYPTLFTRFGDRLQFKLKHEDFPAAKPKSLLVLPGQKQLLKTELVA